MSFNIELMVNHSPEKQFDKDTTTLAVVNGTLREGTSIIDPVIKIECNLSDFAKCNYMYVPEFGRYYFVTNIRSVIDSIVEFTCHVDVLSSFKQEIRMNTCIVKRQENDWNLYLNDGTFKVYQNPMVLTKAFPSGFSRQEFVLAIAGS